MYDLTYCSLAKADITADEISSLLKSAKKHNKENNITGCLFYYNYEFLQVLEGEEGIVKAVFTKISKDKRHSNVRILAEGKKEKRTFDSWTMAYKELNAEEMKNLNDSSFENNFLTFSELVSKPTRAIRSFWQKAQHILMKNEG